MSKWNPKRLRLTAICHRVRSYCVVVEGLEEVEERLLGVKKEKKKLEAKSKVSPVAELLIVTRFCLQLLGVPSRLVFLPHLAGITSTSRHFRLGGPVRLKQSSEAPITSPGGSDRSGLCETGSRCLLSLQNSELTFLLFAG